MSESNNNLPAFQAHKFICPYCDVFAQQDWNSVRSFIGVSIDILKYIFAEYRTTVSSYDQRIIDVYNQYVIKGIPIFFRNSFLSDKFSFSKCQSCNNTVVWLDKKIIYPIASPIPEPNKDLGDEIKILYLEARNVHPLSTRSSAALLRLCIEKLCVQVGAEGKILNEQIKSLVKKGVSQQIQQAFDYCRVIGNNAVHPGVIDIEEDPNRVLTLFSLVNDIAQEIITKPKEMKEKYASLPSANLDQIEKRDGNQ